MGDMIMCANLPGSEQPIDVDDAHKYSGKMSKEEMQQDITHATDAIFATSVGVATITAAKAISDIQKGSINSAKTNALLTGVSLGTGTLAKVASDERKYTEYPSLEFSLVNSYENLREMFL